MMETQKRIQLKPFEGSKEPPEKTLKLAIRFDIKLEESTDEKCPEISYTDLLLQHELKRRKRTSSSPNSMLSGRDLFGHDGDENVEALAKLMEEKYGKSYGGVSRGMNIDLGDGYNSEDSFIDNEEAYDELVPSSLTTKHGGFYINTGVLDFKEISDDEIVSDTEINPKKKKKRVLKSSESEEEDGKSKAVVKKKRLKKTMSLKAADSTSKKSLLAKKRKKILTPEQLDKERIKKNKLLQKKKLVERAQLKLSEKELNSKAKQYDSLIDDVINNQASRQSATASAEMTKVKEQKGDPVKLPDNISEECLKYIKVLREAADKSVDEKSKFFTSSINSLLTNLDNEVRKIGSSLKRNAIYSHLSSFLPINRETLMKRMKMLRFKEMQGRLLKPIDDLDAAINAVMPAQIEKFNIELQARQAIKSEDTERQKEDTQDSEEDAPSTNQPEGHEEKKKERVTFRKKFEWTEGVREKLAEVVTIKMESYQLLKAKGQTAEEYVKEFLENEIRILWPKGWMQSRTLYREMKYVHAKWTNPTAIPPVPKPVPKKPALIPHGIKMAASMNSTAKKSQSAKSSQAVKDGVSKPSANTAADSKELKLTASSKSVVKSHASAHNSPSSGNVPISSRSGSFSNISENKSQEDLSKAAMRSTLVKTVESGEKVLTGGNKKSSTSSANEKRDSHLLDSPLPLVKSEPSVPKPLNISISKSSHGSSKSNPLSFSGKSSSPGPSSLTNSSRPSVTAANQMRFGSTHSDEALKRITLNDSAASPSSLTLPPSSLEGSIGTTPSRRNNAKSQGCVSVESQAAASALLLLQTKALHQQHLAASLAGQQAMLQHKKVADSLATQQKVAKQKQIAAIAAEQKAAASIASQQRIAQQALANQQKFAQSQQQQKLKQQQIAEAQQKQKLQQQKLQSQQQKAVQQQKMAQQKLGQSQQRTAIDQQAKMVQAQQKKAAQAQQQQQLRQQFMNQPMTSPMSSVQYRPHDAVSSVLAPHLGTPSLYSPSTSPSPATSSGRQVPAPYPFTQPAASPIMWAWTSVGANPSWPAAMQQHPQMSDMYRRSLEVRRKLDNTKK